MVTKVNLIDKLQTDLGNYLLCKRHIFNANMEICSSFKSFAGGTCGFSYREDRSCISQVVPLHSCKKDISSHLRSCKFSDPENEVDLILSLAGIFETLTDIDDITICPTQMLGRVVVPIVDIEYLKRCPPIVIVTTSKVKSIPKPIGELESVYHR